MSGDERSAEQAQRHLSLRGGNHLLQAMPVGDGQWVGMITITSPTEGAALLTPEHAAALRDWLDLMLSEHPKSCPCGHTASYHHQGECLVCEVCE